MGVLERRVEVGAAPALAGGDVVGEEVARAVHQRQLVIDHGVRLIGDAICGRLAVAICVAQKADLAGCIGSDLIIVVHVALNEMRQLALAKLISRRERRLAFTERRAAFGEDLDDAVCGIGSIERARGGTLDDFDASDVFRVDVRQSEAGDRAVDDDQRILPPGQARCRAKPNGRLRARLAGCGDHARAGNLAFERSEWGDGRCFLDLRGVDDSDVEGRPFELRGGAGARDDDFIQVEYIALEREIVLHWSERRIHEHMLGLVSDRSHREGEGAPQPALRHGERVSPFGRGDSTDGQLRDSNIGATERLSGRRGYASAENGLLRGRDAGRQSCH